MSVVPISKKLGEAHKTMLAVEAGVKPAMLKAFFAVEGSGVGFSDFTGLMLIQFEPTWMDYFTKGTKVVNRAAWINNGVSNQAIEYAAFNKAKKDNASAALKSTSIGIGQVMGFHYKRLGFNNPLSMWNYATISEYNQAKMVVNFIKTDKILYQAVKDLNFSVIAERYNGAGFRELAERLNIVPYDEQLRRAYERFNFTIPVKRTTTTVNIRTGAGSYFNLAGKPLFVNTPVEVKGTLDGWSNVIVVATGLQGWVKSDYLK